MTTLFDTITTLITENFELDYPEELRPNLAAYIDHTALKAQTTLTQIETLCEEARAHKFASVCVNPSHVSRCADLLKGSGVRVCTVIGFPLGANTPEAKGFETKQAVLQGADEVDMVINLGALIENDYKTVFDDIRAVVLAAKTGSSPVTVKVIIETAYLSNEAKQAACILSQRAGAHYVKTSTGFGSSGATVEDVKLMRETVGPKMGVKASGGIRDRSTAEAMIQAGATRLGVSAGVEIVRGETSSSSY
ncbi:MAG: deoxyribose-phosphate aldolase [Sumerlaeia bacterium]